MKRFLSTISLTVFLVYIIGCSSDHPAKPDNSSPETSRTGAAARVAPTVRTNLIDGAKMVYIPDGEFPMGDDDLWEIKKNLNKSSLLGSSQLLDDNPRHMVKLSGFWMYKNVVTVAQYKTFCAATGRRMPHPPEGESIRIGDISASSDSFNPNWSKEDHPIVNVTWFDAMAYAQWAQADLPTEAEWEKAARGTDGRKYPWGEEFDPGKLWCSRNPAYSQLPADGNVHVVYPGTHKVGELGVGPYGSTDMAGNVDQWCKDWYNASYWNEDHGPDPQGPATGTLRVMRGSAWQEISPRVLPLIYRSTYRRPGPPEWRGVTGGFRCVVREPQEPERRKD